MDTTIRNFHIPLPEEMYARLRDLANRQNRPATQLARQAVEDWLKEQEKLLLHEEIAHYATQAAGTLEDLDEQVEAAGLEHVGDEDKNDEAR